MAKPDPWQRDNLQKTTVTRDIRLALNISMLNPKKNSDAT